MSLEEKVSHQPIKLPDNPFWDVFKRFGRDEIIALGVNLAATVGVQYALDYAQMKHARDVILSTAGPVIEKVGFFPAHAWDAHREYQELLPQSRRPFNEYLRSHLRQGTKSLVQDVVMHDPFYVGLMWLGLKQYPDAPAWMVSMTSFLAAVVAVAGVEVSYNELAHQHYKRRLKHEGFGLERYYESRFLVRSDRDAVRMRGLLEDEFALDTRRDAKYVDRYFVSRAPERSGRGSGVRLRHRVMSDGAVVDTAQIVFSRASEMQSPQEQFRYFPRSKEKMYLRLDAIPEQPYEVGRMFAAAAGAEIPPVSFGRHLAYNSKLLMAVDDVNGKEPFYVVELKTHGDLPMLKRAMRFVMNEFPVLQTTHSKLDLVRSNE